MPLERPGKQVRRPGGWPALQCDEERLMTNESMVKITNLGVADPALPKPNPPPPTPIPATETDLRTRLFGVTASSVASTADGRGAGLRLSAIGTIGPSLGPGTDLPLPRAADPRPWC